MPHDDLPHRSSGTLADAVPSETPSVAQGVESSLIRKLAFPLAFVALALTLVVLFARILKVNDGTFVYTLDDPYIHLALSDQIRHGNYGLSPTTHAAPSSSIVFPFILATAAGTALHPYLPLLINVCALFFTAEVIRRFLIHLKLGSDAFAAAVQPVALFLMVLCFNLVGVAFTGLEHSLHIATVAAIVYGLVLLLDFHRMPFWLPAAIVVCPLVRYEGLALSIPALFVLAFRGRPRTALIIFAVVALLVGGFSAFLVKLGLAPLPSSVLTKSPVAAGGVEGGHPHFLHGLIKNADFMTTHSTGLTLLLIAVAVACVAASEIFARPRRLSSRGLMAFVLVCMIAAQAAAGRFGWLERYEVYLILAAALICTYLAQSSIRGALAPGRKDRYVLAVGAFAVLLVFGARYLDMTRKVPLCSNNIYEQQLQMHRFVDVFYRDSVAINDLGLISYHNPYPVLDLGGLGSEKARLLIAKHANAADYEAFVAENEVHLVMVYQEWFPAQIPKTWQHVGTMLLSREHVSAAQDGVQFYATDDTTAAKVRAELAAFRAVLPSRVGLTIY